MPPNGSRTTPGSWSSRSDSGNRGLERLLRRSPTLRAVLDSAATLGLPQWYLGAGCVAQTVWNHLHGFDLAYGIKDVDLVYFDASDLTEASETATERRTNAVFGDLGVELDVKNEARVHLWYAQRFGEAIPPYTSSEDAISTWPTTASSIGVRYDGDEFIVCAPFGLDDMFDMIVRPNKRQVTQQVYERKAGRWAATWPKLTVLPW